MNNFTLKTLFFHFFINNITIFYNFVLYQSTYCDRIDYVKKMFSVNFIISIKDRVLKLRQLIAKNKLVHIITSIQR